MTFNLGYLNRFNCNLMASRGRGIAVALFCLSLTCGPTPLYAQWTTVGPGVEYQSFRVGNTNDFFVTRMSRTNVAATIDTMFGQGRLRALETVRNQATRYDDAITWWGGEWGARNDVVVAINGGFYDLSTFEVSGGQIQSGWYSHFFADSFSGFAWRTNRTPFIGECVNHVANRVYVRFQSNGNTQPIDGINRAPAASDLVIFTPQYNTQTPSGTRTEVLVEMTKPNLTTTGSGYSSGIIRSKAQNTGSTWIPFDHLVLSADGSDGTTLNANASVGSEVRIFQDLYEENEPDVQGNNACQTATGVNWANTFSTINANFHFLKNNVVRVPDAVAHPGYIGYVNLNPRTAICYNADYVFFLVVDGRSARSKGIGCADMGYWAKAVLGATDGVNLDGGGSSTMVVNGVVKNVPSDGNERSVCNGVMIVSPQPKITSTVFATGQTVTTSGSANIRLGPGLNYGIYSSAAAGAQGTVVSHQLNGVFAKGTHWWKCNFGGTVGWISESLLIVPATAPNIIQEPSNRSVMEGGSTSLTISATGSTPLSYRWQKNNVNLSNGGHYAGVTTNTLTITGADNTDVGSYRCVVTNAYGSDTSSVASLTLVVGCAPGNLVNADFESGNTGGVGNAWTGYQRAPLPSTVWSIQTASPPQGAQYQQIANTSSTGGGGVRQNITGCIVGATYTISGWMRGNSTLATCRVKVSPTASTDWASAVDLNPAQSYSGADWIAFSGTVVATGTNMTLWLDGQTGSTGQNKAECFDAITLSCALTAVPPGIAQQPSNQSTSTGGSASFTILATGNEPLSYRWQKNNTNLNNGGHYSGVTTATLAINLADASDAANYRCVVTNAYGSTNSAAATLTVTNASTPPGITQHPSNQNIPAGETASFTILATGSEPLSYVWQKNNTNLSNGGHYSGVTTNTLIITGADNNDVASYRCVVTNAYGSTNSGSATLTVVNPNPCLEILNGDFESGFSLTGGGYIADHWTEWEADPGVIVGYDESTIVHGGAHAQRLRVSGTAATSGGVYQRVPVIAGNPYTVGVWMYADDALTACSLGVDPAGGTNASSGVTWSSASTNAAWVQKTWTGIATTNYLTVFYRVSSPDNVKRNGYFDDTTPAASSAPLQLTAQRSGNNLILTWPECPDARLERAESLVTPMSWTTVPNAANVAGGQKSVTLTPTGNTGYFRLVLN